MKAAQANLDYATQTHIIEHRLENKGYYDQLDIRFKLLAEYKDLLSTLNNRSLLNKALSLGQVTIIQYFYDESFYFITYDKYLQTEWEYHEAVAKLYKFLL